MIPLTIKVQSLKDAKAGIPILEGATIDQIEMVHPANVVIGIMEAGTEGGQTVLSVNMKCADGTYRCCQLTAALFEGLYVVFKGVQGRFKEEKLKREN